MRVLCLDIMQALDEFTPRLIGSVSTGRIRKNSDIDLHVFVDEIEILETKLDKLGWAYTEDSITINKNGKMVSYTHIYIDMQFPVELSVYPRRELRVRSRSSTDGKPILRVSSSALLQLILDEHGEAWSQHIKQE
ncbi:nucleotidyltransferase domain-containing protein [Alkalimarinus coralli]|uniref:nucleotidyltransferase domain-containing protein n=1 Tax=Alkalimarinus coralli TaxID=2935863 RepID=UPI00202B498F|nr:nucleotidyltransferase domain-containing protein [Alkalimarinus coralli]